MPPVDRRLALIRIAGRFAVIVLASLAVKQFAATIVTIHNDHMSPVILNGDRTLVTRGLAHPLQLFGAPPRPGAIVITDIPNRPASRACLRVCALPGDTVAIDGGTITKPSRLARPPLAVDSVLPAEFSPRDYTRPYVLPRRGQTITLDSLCARDLIFAASIVAQQNRGTEVDVRVDLLVDGIPSNEYIIRGFHLYGGRFDSIPNSFDFDWFFWDRLEQNLRYNLTGRAVAMKFAVHVDGERVAEAKMRRGCVFLLADNWAGGFDSRYAGPVSVDRITGTVAFVLWSPSGMRLFGGTGRTNLSPGG